jgi:hypothetical protein
VTTPDESTHHPGPPPLLWAPSLVNISEIPWRPGFAAWHRNWRVWVRLIAEDVYGDHTPHDGILLAPENPTDGAPDLAGRVAHLEEMLRKALGR